MPRCGATVSSDTYRKRCDRSATPGFPFCWQHGRGIRHVVSDLEAYGPNSPEFLLQHLTYRSKVFDESLFNIKARTITSSSGPRTFNGDRNNLSLGYLEVLPLEVLWIIFSQLSIPELVNFKATNSHARQAVSTSAQSYCISTYAPQLIAALYNRNLSSAFPVGRIYEALIQAECSACGRFAGYILLPGLQRCCQRCAAYDKEFWPITLEAAKAKHAIPQDLVPKLPRMRESRKHIPSHYEDYPLYPISNDGYLSDHDESDHEDTPRPNKPFFDNHYTLVSKAEARVRVSLACLPHCCVPKIQTLRKVPICLS